MEVQKKKASFAQETGLGNKKSVLGRAIPHAFRKWLYTNSSPESLRRRKTKDEREEKGIGV